MDTRRFVALVLIGVFCVGAVAFIVVAIVYFTNTPAKLPSFFPGYISDSPSRQHYNKRGIASLVVGLALLALGVLLATRSRSPLRR